MCCAKNRNADVVHNSTCNVLKNVDFFSYVALLLAHDDTNDE